MDGDDSILSEWGQLRDDSSLNLLLDTHDLEGFGSLAMLRTGKPRSFL